MWLAFAPMVAKVELPSLLTGHMVVQQQSNVRLWGKGIPGSKVKVTPSWYGQKD